MKISDKVKGLIEYWSKGFVLITCVILIMNVINMTIGSEFISQFAQGFIVATSWFYYSQYQEQKSEEERIHRVIEEMEELIRKYDTDEEIQNEIGDKLEEELKNDK